LNPLEKFQNLESVSHQFKSFENGSKLLNNIPIKSNFYITELRKLPINPLLEQHIKSELLTALSNDFHRKYILKIDHYNSMMKIKWLAQHNTMENIAKLHHFWDIIMRCKTSDELHSCVLQIHADMMIHGSPFPNFSYVVVNILTFFS
jgi:hypothetical protein